MDSLRFIIVLSDFLGGVASAVKHTRLVEDCQVYDKPMCCATGVCGPQVDPVLPRFAADLDWNDYCAIMTCSQADDACPVVMGCNLRVPVRYEDPKVADGTEREAALYDERSRQICREMFFMMSLV